MSSDRKTVNQALDSLRMRQRQDISYLEELVRGAYRNVLPSRTPLPDSEVRALVHEYKKGLVQVSGEKVGDLPDSVFVKVADSMPVCGILGTTPIHPPGRNQSQGHVLVNRTLGGTPHAPLGLPQLAGHYGAQILEQKYVYTGGTWKGFLNRLTQQMGRKTVAVRVTANPLRDGTPLPMKRAIKLLDALLPRDPVGDWPGVTSDLYTGLTEGIKITCNSSAGPPYHQNKCEVLDKVIDIVIPLVLKAVKENSLTTLMKQNPELFLGEVKNKTDRYEKAKLDDKTRPYFCLPAHWSLLFSILSQGFQKGLRTFDKDFTSSNAYGFSMVDGGMTRMVEWMRSCPKGRRGRGVFYGDDGKIVFWKEGKLYMADPDFKQMDGSLDKDDVALTIEWILDHVRRELKEDHVPPFWRTIGNVWLEMATNPTFIVDGKTIYRKRQNHGLMTGIPGTTLFDTVKSTLAWNALLDDASLGRVDLLNESQVVSWMAKNGLVVKEGTWSPAEVPEDRHGQLITDHKFLGVQTLCLEHKGALIHVPTLPEDEALQLILCQKDNPYEKRRSSVQDQRRLYDRMRGLMITVGFSIPDFELAINAVVNSIPGHVIIMQTQEEGGEKPDHIGLQEFTYPDSSGFPSREFCLDLYKGGERGNWLDLYPTLVDTLKALKESYKNRPEAYGPQIKTLDDGREHLVLGPRPSPPPIPPEYELTEALNVASFEGLTEFFPRSRVFRFDGHEEIPAKYIPNMGETLLELLEGRGGVETVNYVRKDLNCGLTALLALCKKMGVYITGERPTDLVSLRPLIEPLPTLQVEVKEAIEENKNLLDKGLKSRRAAARRAPVMTQPEIVFIDAKRMMNMKPPLFPISDRSMAHAHVMNHLQAMGTPLWRPLGVKQGPTPVGVGLYLDPSPNRNNPGKRSEEVILVAEAWSVNSRTAKDYIVHAALEMNGTPFYETDFTPTILPPPPEASWSAQVAYEQDPGRIPLVAPSVDRPTGSELRELEREFPNIPSRLLMEISVANYQFMARSDWKDKTRQILKTYQTTLSAPPPPRQGRVEGPDTGTSKRSKLTPQRRKALNRKTTERRRQRLASSKQPAA